MLGSLATSFLVFAMGAFQVIYGLLSDSPGHTTAGAILICASELIEIKLAITSDTSRKDKNQ